MSDKFYVYRPLLDLFGLSEGTDKRDAYNETLGYGIMLDGKVTKGKGSSVSLVAMTLAQVDALQSRMLKDPDNRKLNSSAAGRYQIVRTTRREIEKALPERFPPARLFDEECQDEMACYRLGVRGIDKYLAGRLSEDTMILNLAREWASLPTPEGKGYYGGQHASVSVQKVRSVLAEVKKRHLALQPAKEVVPPDVEKKVAKETGLWSKISGAIGGGTIGLGWIAGADWKAIAVLGVLTLLFLTGIFVMRRKIIAGVKEIREGLA